MKFLGLINARGGSKGIPGKNIKSLLGRPLIAYSIEAALASRRLDRVVVSTDSMEIAEIAAQFGADVPFLRPAELATDTSLQIDSVHHALTVLQACGQTYDAVVILQPTSPLRTAEDINASLSLMERSNADTVISVVRESGRLLTSVYNGCPETGLAPLDSSSPPRGTIRQHEPEIYRRNGAIYVVQSDVVLRQGVLYGSRICGIVMPPERSIDIDTPFDWKLVETIMQLDKSV